MIPIDQLCLLIYGFLKQQHLSMPQKDLLSDHKVVLQPSTTVSSERRLTIMEQERLIGAPFLK